jgi:SAM-dependent methyltransferase
MTGSVETYQLSVEAAEAYEARFVPALFAEWAPRLVEAAGVAPGQTVLDVACGTGVVARAAADRLGGRGRVVGLDLNRCMLAVAGRLRPDLEWRQGDAADLPFEDGSFDVVLCQSALMFFPDRAGALREMTRVATAGGTVAVQVWDRLEAQPGYGSPAPAPGSARLGRRGGRDRDRRHPPGPRHRPGRLPADPGRRRRGHPPVPGPRRPGRAAHRGPPGHRGQERLIGP